MKLEAIELKCKDCGKEFSSPIFGDQSYGRFIFHGEKGDVFAHFQALENPAWKFIESVLKKKGSGREADIAYGERLQSGCAFFADPVKGQRLRNHYVCPRCYSNNIFAGRDSNEVLDVPEVSHSEFLSMPETVRQQKVLEYDRSHQS